MRKVSPILDNPVMVEVAHHGDTAATVEQYILPIENKKKQELLQAVLGEKGGEKIIVFTRTKKRAEECTDQLRDAGFAADSIHSDKPQHKRKRALERFAKGKTNILVATDVLARGIDVPSVDYVVNYDLPDMADDYVHRIGRTGRAGEVGFAVSFVTRESRRELHAIETLINRELPMMELESYDVDPNILESKNKNKHGKKKHVRARDIERATAHNEKAKKGGKHEKEPRDFQGLNGYKSRFENKGGKSADGARKGSSGKGGKLGGAPKGTKFDKYGNKQGGSKPGKFQKKSKGNGSDKRNAKNDGFSRNAKFDKYGNRTDERAGGKRGSASHKKRYDSPKPKSKQGIRKAQKQQTSFDRFYGKNGR